MLERTKRDLDLRRQMLDQQFEGAETKGGVRRERHRCDSACESGCSTSEIATRLVMVFAT